MPGKMKKASKDIPYTGDEEYIWDHKSGSVIKKPKIVKANKGQKVSKYYKGGGNVITGRD